MSCQDHTNTDISDSLTTPADISDSLTTPADIFDSLTTPADISDSLTTPADISDSLTTPADYSSTQITLSGSFGEYQIIGLERFIVKYKQTSCICDSVDRWSASIKWCNVLSRQSKNIFLGQTISRSFGEYQIIGLEHFIVKYKQTSCICDSVGSWITSSKWYYTPEIRNRNALESSMNSIPFYSSTEYLSRRSTKPDQFSLNRDNINEFRYDYSSQGLRNTYTGERFINYSSQDLRNTYTGERFINYSSQGLRNTYTGERFINYSSQGLRNTYTGERFINISEKSISRNFWFLFFLINLLFISVITIIISFSPTSITTTICLGIFIPIIILIDICFYSNRRICLATKINKRKSKKNSNKFQIRKRK